ncbi:3-carboxy-cis,cis-muconate cycloisomerase [Mycolicibacterium chubuense]|uniref:3-carboxy-cis,cis-muconate cycloisomerase n=1 Tax=Mycolicibacterium chubuense TaxID=1800 RepID=A0A0J6WS14_MYCCU|nr:lyase family protein [Mycolicibacterium chubuense]KMO84527.1 3-carboxy-cis,cis-muconate cycloisomerase [Mycolicibacterium chubuense]ORA46536.1 3-carboxy-cis,cis-muconate cycloisomerase [Mycolicibacterium chubuense]SPY00502.1 3-carboxy-cis,cis-muconate cycloisomerase [Mycolicibacterium chubuense]
MADLFWPGDHRAGAVMSDEAFLAALVDVENAWLAVLVEQAVAPASAAADMTALVDHTDAATIAAGAEKDGNPVTGLVALLRSRTGGDTARWLHRGLTSQDVLDTALMLCLRDALDTLGTQLNAQVQALAGMVAAHRYEPLLTRTLTQPALPGSAGLKFAVWLGAVLDAAETLDCVPAPSVQAGGAAGTLAAATELTGSADAALAMSAALAVKLSLAEALPWHTSRARLTRAGDALVTCCDAWGHIANDVAAGVRAGELAESSGGGSSTMPHKSNPVLTVLLRRAALTAPALGATLHSASAASVDERSDGGWHAEWAALRTLVRTTVVAASQATDLLTGLRFDAARARSNLHAAEGIDAEQQAMAELADRQPAATYSGAADQLVDAALRRATAYLKET